MFFLCVFPLWCYTFHNNIMLLFYSDFLSLHFFILHYCIFHILKLLVKMLEPKIVSQTKVRHHFM